jgi:hypothetical protein
MLAYYVEWHMRRALAPILFMDQELSDMRKQRDPDLPAKSSASAKAKKCTLHTEDGLVAHRFDTLIAELACRGRNTFRLKSDPTAPTFKQLPKPAALQARA